MKMLRCGIVCCSWISTVCWQRHAVRRCCSNLKQGEYHPILLAGLLAGKPVDISLLFFADARAVKDLQEIIINARPGIGDTIFIETLALFWRVIPTQHIGHFETVFLS